MNRVSSIVPAPAPAALVDVELARMHQQAGIRTARDDWTGVTNAAERRKLQNRLSQRRYRQARADPRRRAQISAGVPPASHGVAPAAIAQQELAAKFRGLTQAVLTYASTDNIAGSPSQDNTGHSFQATCMAAKTRQPQMQPDDIKRWAVQFEAIIQKHFLMGSPRVDLLLTLVQFNVFRALISNTQSLGWDFEWLECGEPSSPWVMECQDVPYACPLSLRPTSIQRKIDHHPWIDLWPIPKMRDNLLLAAGLYDEDELCNALVEFKDVPNEQSGLVVWGEPWDPASWEVSETFAQNWAWTIQGCTELMGSTNRWRSQRGDKPIVTWTADISKSPVGDGESL